MLQTNTIDLITIKDNPDWTYLKETITLKSLRNSQVCMREQRRKTMKGQSNSIKWLNMHK